ncbi:nuclear transport factor 2 family protein [Actinokineospora enzanensis]|uniref:nuclear transport factor 2 family protein n=1 Tax=Actinokineospora enzanensis TaxID=155975 RepID=UPI000369D5B0|nr:nuclear transport factor 2 family protein [Actinokineospora enzanensis]
MSTEGMSPERIVAAYFDAWRARDFDRYQSLLADDFSFVGPLATLTGAVEARRGIEGMAKIITDLVVLRRFVEGDEVLTWFELHAGGVALPTANWAKVEGGRIVSMKVTFDPRPLFA